VRAQIHLLDATYELFRAHFGRPGKRDPEGREVGATVGIVESVLSLLRTPGVTHVACATDHVIRSWRNERFAGYKTDAGVAPELLAQFTLAEESLGDLGVTVWPMIEFEADDAIATAAARWAEAPDVERVVILSPDKDMSQCVREDGRVVTYDRRRQAFVDADAVRAKFGVSPRSIPDYLALVGDAADGLPGIPGWGPKSAAIALQRYGTIEAIPARSSAWDLGLRGADRLAAALRERFDQALIFRELATLRLDVPLRQTIADLEWHGVPRDRFERRVRILGAPHLLGRVHRWAAQVAEHSEHEGGQR
jgi:5'-3' exonuclease